MKVALGFRPHSGWTAAVTVGERAGRPVVLGRWRLELSTPDVPVQAYHAAAGLDPASAATLVERAHDVARELAGRGLDACTAELRADGREPVAVGLPVGSMAIPRELAKILGSHPLLHAAEGDLFREVIAEAAEQRGLRIVEQPARELPALAQRAFGVSEAALPGLLAELGQTIGRPWRKDDKDATILGWLALTAP